MLAVTPLPELAVKSKKSSSDYFGGFDKRGATSLDLIF